ncbi:MAG TPA: hypothetical protein VFH83_07065, partial [Spirochaetia bacterium]|nr:hypothetical protein [Spirochaetia bacterium]
MLRRAWLLLLLMAAPIAPLAAQVEASAVVRDWEALTRLAPRPEGSANEKLTVAYVESRLADLGAGYTPFDFQESDFEHSFSTCLRVDIPGQSRDSVLVVAPLNSPPDAAEGQDGSINLALALDLVARARQTPYPLGLTVLFLGAEYGDSDAYPMGTALFLRDFQPGYRVAVLYLDLRAAPTAVVLNGGGRGIVSPYWLVNRCVDALRSADVPFALRAEEYQLDRMGLPEGRSIIEPYLNAGFPTMGIQGEYGPADSAAPAERLAQLGTFLSRFLEAGRAGIADEWDRHYLLFQIGSLSLIIPERVYLVCLLGGLGGMLLISLIFRRGLRKYMRTLVRGAWAIVPIAGLSFVFLFAGTCVLQGILSLRGFPDLWTHAPLEFLGLKIAIALLLYGALYPFMRRLPFPRRGSFYSAAAILFLLIDIVVVSAFNVSFTYYFLWALFFVFLSGMVPNRYAKVLLFLPAPFWGLRALFVVFSLPSPSFGHFLLLSPVWGDLLVAGVCLPFILMLLRFGRLFPGRGLLRRGVREIGFAAVLFAGTYVLQGILSLRAFPDLWTHAPLEFLGLKIA